MARKHSKTLARAARFPIYLWIAGLYPILHLYDQNFGLVRDNEVAQTIAAMLSTTTLAYLTTKPLQKNPHKRALLLTIWSLAFSLGGRFYEELFYPRSLVAWTIGALLLAFMATITLRNRLSKATCAHLTAPLNLIFALLLALPLISLLPDALAQRNYVHASAAYFQTPGEPRNTTKIMDSPDRPDIYYIIPDGYPSDQQLLTDMNFDNTEFTQALRERGFMIAPHAQSNYGATHHSLASTLNLRYFEVNPSDFHDLNYLRLSTANSEVARLLQSLGYTYIHYLSGYVFPSAIADINRDFSRAGVMDVRIDDHLISARHIAGQDDSQTRTLPFTLKLRQPFAPLYLDTTWLRGIYDRLENLLPTNNLTALHRMSPERFLYTLADLTEVAAMPEATFAIIHLMQPHTPVNFNENGDIIEQNNKPSPAEFYADLRYSNSQFLRIIDTILQDSANEPVIVFQADHGSHFGKVWTADNRLTHFDIYAAYYLPEPFAMDIPKPFTLVNSFTLILNEVFATGHDLLPDRLYEIPKGYDAPFEQVDVTEEFLQK